MSILLTELAKKRFITLCVVVVVSSGCASVQGLYMLPMNVTGSVVDSTSGDGVSEAEILFVDCGLDELHDQRGSERRIVATEDSGEFDHAFEYSYCRTHRVRPWNLGDKELADKPGAFDIVVAKPGYEPQRFSYVLGENPRDDDGRLRIELGVVELVSEPD